ncbi:MAG: glycosyltransferase family 4 protein [Patescibacteria group bacterium]
MIIGIDIRNIGKGRTGDEVVFFNLVKNLSRIDSKNEYRLLTDRDPKYDRSLDQEIKKLSLRNNFTVVNLGKRGINKFIWNFWTLPRFIRQDPTDIYLTQYIVPFFIPREIRVITIIHDVSFRVYPKLIRLIDRLLLGILIPRSLRRADKIIGVSRFTKEEIQKYFSVPERKLDWIHNAVSDEILNYQASPEKEESVRKKYSLPEKFILYLGTMQPRKNLPLLIRSFSQLSKLFPEVKLVLAGGKSYHFDKNIETEIGNLGIENQVIFTGFIKEEDKPEIFRLAKIFCFPSLYEGFGIPILEAFALGIPVVASRIAPHLEIAGNAALLFEPRKGKSLFENMKRIIENEELAEELRTKGKKRLSDFSWEKTAKKMLEIFSSLQ